jgi:hypothetical protein
VREALKAILDDLCISEEDYSATGSLQLALHSLLGKLPTRNQLACHSKT